MCYSKFINKNVFIPIGSIWIELDWFDFQNQILKSDQI